jgi:hypothetical protein
LKFREHPGYYAEKIHDGWEKKHHWSIIQSKITTKQETIMKFVLYVERWGETYRGLIKGQPWRCFQHCPCKLMNAPVTSEEECSNCSAEWEGREPM